MKNVLFMVAFLVMIFSACGSEAAETVKPRKIQVDTNHDGKIDRIEIYDRGGQVVRVEADTTGDGKTDEWIHYENGNPVKSEKDTNADGKPDVWMEY